jgi:hypothetical protein
MRTYLGSVSDDSIGIGTIVKGSDYRYHLNDCFEILLELGYWIECYDVVRVLPNGEVEWISTDPK